MKFPLCCHEGSAKESLARDEVPGHGGAGAHPWRQGTSRIARTGSAKVGERFLGSDSNYSRPRKSMPARSPRTPREAPRPFLDRFSLRGLRLMLFLKDQAISAPELRGHHTFIHLLWSQAPSPLGTCRFKMRMSGLCKVEMSASWVAEGSWTTRDRPNASVFGDCA